LPRIQSPFDPFFSLSLSLVTHPSPYHHRSISKFPSDSTGILRGKGQDEATLRLVPLRLLVIGSRCGSRSRHLSQRITFRKRKEEDGKRIIPRKRKVLRFEYASSVLALPSSCDPSYSDLVGCLAALAADYRSLELKMYPRKRGLES